MKKSRKTALAAILFSAAMNMNGCVYGPPPDEAAYSKGENSTSAVAAEEENTSEEAAQTDEAETVKEI